MRFGASAAIAFVTALGALPANAAFIQDGAGTPQGAGITTFTTSGSEATAGYDWSAAPVTMFVDFSSTTQFDLYLTDFDVVTFSSNDISAFTLDLLDTPGGSAVQRYTTDTAFCDSSVQPVLGASGACDLFSFPGSTNSNAFVVPSTTTPLVAAVAAGSYRLGVYDSGSPEVAAAEFTLRAVDEVPGPGALGLLGLGLVSVAARRHLRR